MRFFAVARHHRLAAGLVDVERVAGLGDGRLPGVDHPSLRIGKHRRRQGARKRYRQAGGVT
jgi:hypothetical protein